MNEHPSFRPREARTTFDFHVYPAGAMTPHETLTTHMGNIMRPVFSRLAALPAGSSIRGLDANGDVIAEWHVVADRTVLQRRVTDSAWMECHVTPKGESMRTHRSFGTVDLWKPRRTVSGAGPALREEKGGGTPRIERQASRQALLPVSDERRTFRAPATDGPVRGFGEGSS